MMKKQTALVVLFAAAAVFASGVVAGAQSLAAAAQKEAARRKEVKAPVKVFTNDNIKVVPPVAPQTPPAEAAAPPAAPAAGAGGEAAEEKPPEAPDPQKDPEYWRKRMADAKQARDRNAFLLEAVQSRINALTTDFYARDDPYQRAQIELERNKALRELDLMTKHQAELEKRIADIEEEARRANVPPGWLR
jgi:type IV secretory pathway VirB10-like protein